MKTLKKIAGVILTIAALCGVAYLCRDGCTSPDDTVRVLEQQGYTNIKITGWRPMMAGKDDTFSTGFEATSPSGAHVTGAVTGGWMKGNTIRLD